MPVHGSVKYGYGASILPADRIDLESTANHPVCPRKAGLRPMTASHRRAIRIKRIYEPPDSDDGLRVLIDRLWPRGVSRERAAIDEWMKEIAPSPELRAWFGHRPERFEAFARLYGRELAEDPVRLALADRLCAIARERTVTLVYAARDPVHNHAAVLRSRLERRMESGAPGRSERPPGP